MTAPLTEEQRTRLLYKYQQNIDRLERGDVSDHGADSCSATLLAMEDCLRYLGWTFARLPGTQTYTLKKETRR